jgi:hypothetical protein
MRVVKADKRHGGTVKHGRIDDPDRGDRTKLKENVALRLGTGEARRRAQKDIT